MLYCGKTTPAVWRKRKEVTRLVSRQTLTLPLYILALFCPANGSGQKYTCNSPGLTPWRCWMPALHFSGTFPHLTPVFVRGRSRRRRHSAYGTKAGANLPPYAFLLGQFGPISIMPFIPRCSPDRQIFRWVLYARVMGAASACLAMYGRGWRAHSLTRW